MAIRDIINSLFDNAPEGSTLVETASVGIGKPIEGHKNVNNSKLLEVQRWLPLAAQKYETSANIRDYVISPVVIFPSDIPNRNCLAGDTLVATNAGNIAIKELSHRLDATHVLVKNGKAKIKNWMRNGYKPIHDIYTSAGRHIRATSTHPFLVFNPSNCIFKWKRVTELTSDDRVIVRTGSLVKKIVDLRSVSNRTRNKLNRLYLTYPGGKGRALISQLPNEMTNELARLIGHIQAEGSFGKNSVSFHNTNKDLLRDVQKCFLKVFGVHTRIKKRNMNHSSFKGNKPYYSVTANRQDILWWFKEIGLSTKQINREIPAIIMESTNEHICSYLSAYIEGDGSIQWEQVRVHSTSKKTILQMQQLLQSLNIVSVASSRPPKDGTVIHELSFADSFDALRKIGYISKDSAKTYKAWKKSRIGMVQHPSRYRMLPIEVRHWLSRIIKQHHTGNVKNLGARYLDHRGNTHYIDFEISKIGALNKRVDKQRLLSIRDKLAILNPAYGNIVDELTGDFVFDKIEKVSINSVLEPVYDIETTAAQLTANGVVVHNSVAFPYETLMQFNVSQGRPNYKTFVGKPTFSEHAHHDYTKAKGIVFDTYMRPIENAEGNLYKLVALCGFDRTKDYELATAILNGKRKSYSMGAFVAQYECSVCGMLSKPGKMNTECGHVVRGSPTIYEIAGYRIPSYLIARKEITGFEISSVGVPAWSSATTSQVFDMKSY